MFVSEYLQENGERIFENLWFFSPHYLVEAHQFIGTDDVDITPHGVLCWLRVTKIDYDFVKATTASRLFVNMSAATRGGLAANLKASRENCDHLRRIVKTRLIPPIGA
jgi:hypothetical protein